MSDILFETKNHLAKITLNRPQALNALNGDMFTALRERLIKWQSDDTINAIVIRSNCEKAFCAGGDIRAIYQNKNESIDVPTAYFQLEYDVNKIISHYKKPIIALTHGITMGGGVGISIHASHCVAAENLRWAMPETIIGFFPDIGATYYLSRLPDFVGTYLALTGQTIDAQTALELHLIKAIIPQKNFDDLENKIAECAHIDFDRVTKIINMVSLEQMEARAPASAKMKMNMNMKTKHTFCFPTPEEIINALKADNSDWATDTLQQLSHRSPTSLKVTLEQLKRAKNKTVDEVLAMDLHIAHVMLQGHDFFEGIRAAVIDKDKNPKWRPDSIATVTEQDVRKYFGDAREHIPHPRTI